MLVAMTLECPQHDIVFSGRSRIFHLIIKAWAKEKLWMYECVGRLVGREAGRRVGVYGWVAECKSYFKLRVAVD